MSRVSRPRQIAMNLMESLMMITLRSKGKRKRPKMTIQMKKITSVVLYARCV
ncbi:unnamed protein product [Anisakis simplex]|uniref:Alternative protein n=1 Tax=Anisakis simplex TaxID=6269 RepID=A0A0M3JE52_ANISI|nr:unnamed protein product [Anisakis simplex]